MKKFIMGLLSIILMFGMFGPNIKAQNYNKSSKTFEQVSTKKSSDDVKTDYTWKDKKGNIYPIYLHKVTKGENAGKYTCYVFKISAKTGKEYKYYIPNGIEIANDICKAENIK